MAVFGALVAGLAGLEAGLATGLRLALPIGAALVVAAIAIGARGLPSRPAEGIAHT